MRRALHLLSAASLVAALPVAAQAPLKTLAKPDAEYAEPFTQINGVRELRDGRVIVSDVREKTVQLVDLKAGSAQKIGREGSGPGEYAMPMRLLALPGDTSVVYDPLNRRFLVIGPDGKAGPFAPVRAGRRRATVRVSMGARYTDARGRLYSVGPNFAIGPNGEPTIVGHGADHPARPRDEEDRHARLRLHVPTTTIRTSQGGTNVSIRAGGGNPFAAADDWAVTPDGRLAIVRVKDYHVDWYAPNGQKTSGPAIAYEKLKVTEDDKKAFRERRANGGGGTPFVITRAAGAGRNEQQRRRRSPDEPADSRADGLARRQARRSRARPPFAAPNGQVWVLRTRAAKDKIPTYDVFDASGRVVSRVALPQDTRLRRVRKRHSVSRALRRGRSAVPAALPHAVTSARQPGGRTQQPACALPRPTGCPGAPRAHCASDART